MSDAFSQQNDPIPYINSVPGLSAPDAAPKEPPPVRDYTAERLALAEKQGAIDERSIAAIEAGKAKREALAGRKVSMPADPKLLNTPDPPKQDFTDPIKAFQNPAVIIATLGSLFSRAPMTAALKAGGAAMEAYHKGEAEQFLVKREEWRAAAEKARQQNSTELEKYNAAWKKSDHAVADKLAQMQAIAAGVKDEIMIAGIRTGQVDRIDKILESREKAGDKLKELTVKEKNKGNVSLTDAAIDLASDRLVKGDTTALQNIGRGTQGAANISAILNMAAEKGATADQIMKARQDYAAEGAGKASEARTGGSLAANLDIIMRNAHAAIPAAVAASEKVSRDRWVPINKLVQTAESNISDPALKEFKIANLQLAELWARAMNPRGVMRESDRELALGILSTADSKETYKRVVKQLEQFLERERQSVKEFREHREPGTTSGAPAPTPHPNDDGWGSLKVE